ncbi:putative alpha/beta superfamily hydrolase [Rhodanobacter sp. TND4EL1]
MTAVLFGWLAIAGMPRAVAAEVPAHATFTIDSTVLSEVRHINVYTPPDYLAATATRYPVLYMLDGGLAEDFPHVARDVDAAIRANRMRPMIVVGIENTERRRDMTGPTTVASDRAIAPHVGGSFAFREFIADELMPQVRERYRTNGKTAIVGESLAGLFVVETFLLQPSLFDTYVALSPSLWWNHMALARGADARLKAWPGLRRTLYFATASDDDIGDASGMMQTALHTTAPQGLHWSYQAWPELHHDNIYIKASPAVFRQLFPPE